MRWPGCGASRTPTSATRRVDHHRELRQGLPEAVYGPGKTPEQCAGIVGELLEGGTGSTGPVILTRATPEQAKAALAAHPEGTATGTTLVWRPLPATREERVVVVTAGTADLVVADECAAVLIAHGFTPRRITDAGVAGLHRLLPHVDELAEADVVVVAAGMEGALASVIGGSPRRRWSPSPRARATAPGWRASPRCCRCSPRAQPASRSSASTTATARPAP